MKKYVLFFVLILFCARGFPQTGTFSLPVGSPMPQLLVFLSHTEWTTPIVSYSEVSPGSRVYQFGPYGNWNPWPCDWEKWYLRFPNGDIWYAGERVGNETANSTTPHREAADTTEPINVISGNNHFAVKEFSISTPGIPLEFTRYYNSVTTNSSVLGKGWRHSYEWRLIVQTDAAKVITENAQIYTFPKGNGGYLNTIDNNWQLSAQANGKHTLLLPGRIAYQFDANGVLQQIFDSWGNAVSLNYSNGLLRAAEHSNGAGLNFFYTNNLLSKVSAATNLSASYLYNSDGLLTSAGKKADGREIVESYSYSASYLVWRRDAVGIVYNYGYDATNGHAKELYLTSNWYKHTVNYETNRHFCSVVYQNNGASRVHNYDIDPFSKRILTERTMTGLTTNQTKKYAYDGRGNVKRKTISDQYTNNWMQTYRLYDESHNVTDEAFGLNATPINRTVYTWHPEWQVPTAITDPEGIRQEYEYINGVISKSRIYTPYPAATTYSYETNGLLKSVINAKGHSTTITYDAKGYPQSIIPQVGPTVTFGFDSLGHLTNSVFGGRTTTYTCNPLGWVERIDYADGLYEAFQRDNQGRITRSTDRAGRIANYAYAPGGKVSSVSRQFGSSQVTVSNVFDQQFNTLAIKDELNRSVESYTLDSLDRPVNISNVEGRSMGINYLVGGFVGSISRFDYTVVSNQYTDDGQLKAVYYPGATNRYTYLRNGAVRTLENSTGVISNDWNPSSGWIEKISATRAGISGVNSATTYYYDRVGNVDFTTTDLADPAVSQLLTSYNYDEAERLTAISSRYSTSFNYAYNTSNGLIDTVINSNIREEYEYDSLGRIGRIIWKNVTGAAILAFDYQYNAVHMITNVVKTSESEVSTNRYQYDDLDRLTSETRMVKDNAQKTEYYYDNAGTRWWKKDSTGYVIYTGGTGNRLDSWKLLHTNDFLSLRTLRIQGHANKTIGRDNRWGQLYVSNSVAVTPEISGSNFWVDAMTVGLGTQQVVAAIRDQAGNTGYATNEFFITVVTNGYYHYTAAGCLDYIAYTGEEYSSGVSLKWNSQYQLTNAYQSSSFNIRYLYDALGRRVSRFVVPATTPSGGEPLDEEHYVYEGDQVVADLGKNGKVLRSYVWGQGIDNLLSLTVHSATETNTYYALKDHQNTVHALIDATGQIVERYEYDAYGRTTIFDSSGKELTESAIGNRYCFQGREYDSTTGLYYFRARWYDPVTGRWLSNDPIGISGGLNQYVFCANNPVNFVDPMGLDVIIINDENAAGRHGHSGVLVGNSRNGWFYFSKDGYGKNASQWFRTPADFISSTTSDRYNRGFYVPTTRQQDIALIVYGLQNWNKPYAVTRETDPATCETTSENCADLAGSIMIAGGLPVTFPTDSQWLYKKFTDPNDQYEALLRTIPGRNFNPNP